MRKFILLLPIFIFLSVLAFPAQIAQASCTSGSGTRDLNFRTSDEGGYITSGNGSWQSGFGWRTGAPYSDGFTTGVRLFFEVDLGDTVDLTSSSNVTLTVSASNTMVWVVTGLTADRAHSMTLLNTSGTASGEQVDSSGFSDPSNFQVRYLVFSNSHVQASTTPYGGFAAVHLVGTFDCKPTAAFTYDPSSGVDPLPVAFTDTSSANGTTITSWAWDFNDGGTSTSQNPSHTFTTPGTYHVQLTATNPNGSDSVTHDVTVLANALEGSTLTRPLSPDDVDPDLGIVDLSAYGGTFGNFLLDLIGNTDFIYTVQAYSKNSYANVYAGMDGTITGLERISACSGLAAGCQNPIQSAPTLTRMHDAGDIWLVTIDVSDIYQLQYVVRDADQFITWNMDVHAGCILGKTIALEAANPFVAAPSQELTLVALRTTDDHTQVELLSKLTVDPEPGSACNADPRFADCLGSNPQFLRSGDGWSTTGVVNFAVGGPGGAWVEPGGTIYQLMTLDPEAIYGLDTNVLPGQTGEVELWIGSEHETFPVTAAAQQNISLEATTPEGSEIGDGTVFEVGIKNISAGVLIVSHLCVAGDDHSTTPNNCYFHNPGFDLGDSYWTTDGFTDIGFLLLEDTQTASQPVSLGAGDYRVKAVMQISYSGFTPPGTGSAKLQYKYPGAGSYVDIGTVNVTDPLYRYQTFQADFTLTDPVDDVMTFKAVMLTGSGVGVMIDSLCIEPTTGSFPPGPGSGPIVEPPFYPDCQLVIRPQGDAPVQLWINYLWEQLNKFYNCTLMVFLYDLYHAVTTALNTFLMAIRYFLLFLQQSVRWLTTQLIPWLGGYLTNIAQGRTTTIVQMGGSDCHDIFCVITAGFQQVITPLFDIAHQIIDTILSYVNLAVSLLLTTLQLILSIVIFLVQQFFNLFHTLSSTLTQLVTGWRTATPTAIPGLPTCQIDPKSDFICITFWIMENTIFSGRGQLIIPLLISIASVHMLLWTIGVFRREIIKAGEVAG